MTKDSKKLVNILLVDDSYPEIMLAKGMLNYHHINAYIGSARSGIEAIDYLKGKAAFADAVRPDLILLDINMPQCDGKETLEIIKKDPALKHIPVVMYSGSDAPEDIEDSLQRGALHYISKPLNYEKLQEIVSKIDSMFFEEEKGLISLYIDNV